MTVAAGKKALRSSLRRTLSSISPNEIQFQCTLSIVPAVEWRTDLPLCLAGLVCSHVTAHPAFQRARAVSCYLSMSSGELDTRQLIISILEAGMFMHFSFDSWNHNISMVSQGNFSLSQESTMSVGKSTC